MPGVNYEEITYEAYGPGGVAIMIEVLTDNKNRTVGEVRHTLGKHGGNLGEANSVAWMFEKKGYIVVEKSGADEERLLAAAIDAGADDMGDDGDNWEIVSAPETYQTVLDAVKGLGIEPAAAEVALLPKNYIRLRAAAQQMLKLMEILEEHEDTKKVWTNPTSRKKEIEASLA